MHTDILIVGAGPTGLTAANLLARHGVNFRIIDRRAGPIDQSRALALHARTLELFDKLGLAEQALASGQKMRAVNLLINGRQAAVLELSDIREQVSPYPYVLVFEQSKTERLLLKGLHDFQRQVEWKTRLVHIKQSNEEVTAILEHADGSQETITAAYLVGADGASSFVRHALGLTFAGRTYKQNAFLADVHMTWALGHNRWYINLTRQSFLGFFPMEGIDHFRVFGSLTPEMVAKGEVHLDDIRRLLTQQKALHATITTASWMSVYRIHHRVASQLRVGRCFLMGDAAHIHSPAGGQGMNTGIGDAYNLAWKLAMVVKDLAYPHLLASYEAERLPIAHKILHRSDHLFSLETTSNPFLQQARLHLFPALISLLKRLGLSRLVYRTLSQVDFSYRGSPAVTAERQDRASRAVHAGDRAPYGFLADGQTSIFGLLTGSNHHLLLFEGLHPEPGSDETQRRLTHLIHQFQASMTIHVITTANRQLHRVYGVEKASLFCIRPDGHIAYRGFAAHLDAFEAYLNSIFLPTRTRPLERIAFSPRYSDDVRIG